MSAKVYFLPVANGISLQEQTEAMKIIYQAAGADHIFDTQDFVAIKLHVGEKKNTTHLKPQLIRVLVDHIQAKGGLAFLTETSTLYKGERENAVKHILHAHSHGFGIDAVGAPFIMSDGLTGNSEQEVAISGKLWLPTLCLP